MTRGDLHQMFVHFGLHQELLHIQRVLLAFSVEIIHKIEELLLV
jgi:hypothetical protein